MNAASASARGGVGTGWSGLGLLPGPRAVREQRQALLDALQAPTAIELAGRYAPARRGLAPPAHAPVRLGAAPLAEVFR